MPRKRRREREKKCCLIWFNVINFGASGWGQGHWPRAIHKQNCPKCSKLLEIPRKALPATTIINIPPGLKIEKPSRAREREGEKVRDKVSERAGSSVTFVNICPNIGPVACLTCHSMPPE